MPWKCLIESDPPSAADLDRWEAEGWSWVRTIGPCMRYDPFGGTMRTYYTYLHRALPKGPK